MLVFFRITHRPSSATRDVDVRLRLMYAAVVVLEVLKPLADQAEEFYPGEHRRTQFIEALHPRLQYRPSPAGRAWVWVVP
jgi:hypothetical protein